MGSALGWLPAAFVEASGWGRARKLSRGELSSGVGQGYVLKAPPPQPKTLTAPAFSWPQACLSRLHPRHRPAASPPCCSLTIPLGSQVTWGALPAPLYQPRRRGRGPPLRVPGFLRSPLPALSFCIVAAEFLSVPICKTGLITVPSSKAHRELGRVRNAKGFGWGVGTGSLLVGNAACGS